MKKSQKKRYPKIVKSAAIIKPITPKKSRTLPKLIAWIVGGVAVIVVLSAIALGIAANSDNSIDFTNKDTLIVENGKGEEITTEYYHVGDDKFFIKIPTDFRTLTTTEINKKYSGEVPDTVFANFNDSVNIAISVSDSEVKNEQIEEYLNIMIELLKSSSEIISSDYYEVDKHNIATIKVATDGGNGEFYNHMMFFSYNDKLVVIAFNCELDERNDWEQVGDFILNSLYFEK